MPKTKKKSQASRNKENVQLMRTLRCDESYRESENKKCKETIQKLREDEAYRSIEKKKDKEAKHQMREDETHRSVKRQKDKEAKQKMREDDTYRNIEKEKEKEAKQKMREDEAYRSIEKKKDKEAKEKLRENEAYRNIEKEKNKEAKQRLRENEAYRSIEQKKDKEAKEKLREDEAYRNIEKEKNKEAKQRLRENEAYRSIEQKKDKEAKQQMREDETHRSVKRQKDKEAKQKMREDDTYRNIEKEKEKEAKQKMREDETYRRIEKKKDKEAKQQMREHETHSCVKRQKDKEAKQKMREDEAYRSTEKKKDKEAKQQMREHETHRSVKRQKDKEAKQKMREDEAYRSTEKKKDKEAKQQMREDEAYRSIEKYKDKGAKQKVRADEIYKKKENESNKEAMKQLRGSETYKRKEREYDKINKKIRRSDEVCYNAEKVKNKEQKSLLRSVEILRFRENLRQSFKRQGTSECKAALKYIEEIKLGPDRICCCCEGLFFPHSVRKLKLDEFNRKFSSNLEMEKIINFPMSKDVCITCHRAIMQGKVPKLATSKGLKFAKIPECLKILSPLEERMVSPYINFMQIRPLQPYALNPQLSLKGSVVNIPIKIPEILELLPRKFDQMSTVLIRLKRHMEHQSDYMAEVIRPAVVCDALKHLVDTPLYKKLNIQISAEYFERYESKYEERVHFIVDNEEELISNDNIEYIIAAEDGHESDEDEVLLLNRNDQQNNDSGYVIAPGQGNRPVPWHIIPEIDELSFPTIFCGIPMNPDTTITYTDRIKSEIRRHDRRCCIPTRLLYVAKRKLERMCSSNINMCLRKTKHTDKLSVKDIRNKQVKENLITYNDGYQVLKNIRSSPSFWESKKKILLAMIRQLGNPTFFVTVSAAEKDWPELLKILNKVVNERIVSTETAMTLEKNEKTKLIRNDPVTCARYYDYKINKLIQLFKSPNGPFGKHQVEDSYERVEFQMRGSPHEHMFLWLKNSPNLDLKDPANIDECISFIDNFITCKYEEENPYMSMQTHKHTYSCYKGIKNKSKCRFNYPLPVMPSTKILEPISNDFITDKMKGNMKEIKKLMQRFSKSKELMSFEEILVYLKMNESEYIEAIQSSICRTTVFLKRCSNAVDLNCYNKKILPLFESNMDIQFICDAYSCASYIINYVSKVDAGLSKLLREVASEISDGNKKLRDKLKNVVNAFLNGNLMSAQEAAYHALSLPLSKCSRSSIYINTSPIHERVRMLKTDGMLKNADENSNDIFLPDIFEKYSNRSKRLEKICLADYATKFHNNGSKKQENDDENEAEKTSRTKMKILRYRRYRYNQDPANYFREKALLFLPWRNELREIENQNYEELYNKYYDSIRRNQQKYCLVEDEELEKALEEARNSMVQREQEEIEEFEKDKLPLEQKIDILEQEGKSARKDEGRIAIPPKILESDLFSILRGLNSEQRSIVMHVLHCFKTDQLPLRIFLSGSAGVGKSRVIHCINQLLNYYFDKQPGGDVDSIKVLLCAPSGKAAFLINGVTLHTAFALPIVQFGGQMPELSNDVANSIRTKLINLKLLIIDEISMVGSRMLHRIDCRLRQIMGQNNSFGGISVLVVGDLNQLPPVMDSLVFIPPKISEFNVFLERNPLWDEFHLFELKKVMRQKNEKEFIEALNEIATGVVSLNSKRLFTSRIVNEFEVPTSAIRLYPDNLSVNDYNSHKLSNHPGEEINSEAVDKIFGKVPESSKIAILQATKQKKLNELCGLPNEIKFKLGLKYMITTNVDIEDGLVNGACGELKHIVVDSSGKPIKVWLSFDSCLVGRKARMQSENIPIPISKREINVAPIKKISLMIRASENRGFQVERQQFPLVLAEALTIHKSQGQTYDQVCLNFRRAKKITRNMLYVALSRVTKLEGLFLLGDVKYPSVPKDNDLTLRELKNLREEKGLDLFFDNKLNHEFTIIYQNVRSIKKYLPDILVDNWYQQGNVLVFSETRAGPNDKIVINGFDLFYRKESQESPVGIMCFVRTEIEKKLLEIDLDIDRMEGKYQSHVSLFTIMVGDLVVISGYKSPSYNRKKFSYTIQRLITKYVSYKMIILGDFNCDTLKDRFINDIMTKFNLNNCLKDWVTTDTRSQLDICYTNFSQYKSQVYESYFSDHKPIAIAIARDVAKLSTFSMSTSKCSLKSAVS